MRDKTITIYDGVMRRCLADWQQQSIASLTRDQVATRLEQIATANGKRGLGKAQAGQAYRLLRSIIRFAQVEYESDGKPIVNVDPMRNLSKQRPWTEKPRRQGMIQKHQLADWWQAVAALEDKSAPRDYLQLVILTGLRRQESMQLKWQSNIDLKDKYIKLEAIENKANRDFMLPLPDFLVDMLSERLQAIQLSSAFVFPGGRTGTHLTEVRKAQAAITKATGISFTLHDPRS